MLPFVTVDVFTQKKLQGNPLAIVRLPNGDIPQESKQLIAREFNLSETAFLHDLEESTTEGDQIPTFCVDIFLVDREIPFAGHPTVGTGWYILSNPDVLGLSPNQTQIKLRTKAGEILVSNATGLAHPGGETFVSLEVPTNFKIHPPCPGPCQSIKSTQLNLQASDFFDDPLTPFPVVSIVKGMTFLLLRLASRTSLSRLHTTSPDDKLTAPELGEWASFIGLYAYYIDEEATKAGDDVVVHTRMIEGTLEDPATGSAASALTGYLATTAWKEEYGENGKAEGYKYKLIQGVDMGRPSEIGVKVQICDTGAISRLELSGSAVLVMQGTLGL